MPADMTIEEVSEELGRRSRLALEQRRARGEIMTFVDEGWVYREYPDRYVRRLCRVEEFKADDYPEHPLTDSKL